MRNHVRVLLLFFLTWCVAMPARAQGGGILVSGNFAGVLGEDHTNIEAGGTVGYRFTPHVGFDFEVMVIPDLEFGNARGRRVPTLLPGLPIPSFDFDSSGRAVAFLANFVGEFPSPARWLLPYIEGGGGVASVSQTFNITPLAYPTSVWSTTAGPGAGQTPTINFRLLPPGRPFVPVETRVAETNLALTVGGGVDFRIWRGFAIGPSLRYIRLFGNSQDRNLTRIGARASYRF
jgi:hypothetical protein